MYELMEKVTEACTKTDKKNFNSNFQKALQFTEEFKSRGCEKKHARDALLKISYKFRNEDNDLAADCVNEVLAVIDGDNPKIKPIW